MANRNTHNSLAMLFLLPSYIVVLVTFILSKILGSVFKRHEDRIDKAFENLWYFEDESKSPIVISSILWIGIGFCVLFKYYL